MVNELAEKNYEHLENEIIEIEGYDEISCIKIKLIDYDVGIKAVNATNKDASDQHEHCYDEYFKYIVGCVENQKACKLSVLKIIYDDDSYGSMASCAFN